MTTSPRTQRAYDHRLKDLVRETGDIRLATKQGIPRSTARGWRRWPRKNVVTLDVLVFCSRPTMSRQQSNATTHDGARSGCAEGRRKRPGDRKRGKNTENQRFPHTSGARYPQIEKRTVKGNPCKTLYLKASLGENTPCTWA